MKSCFVQEKGSKALGAVPSYYVIRHIEWGLVLLNRDIHPIKMWDPIKFMGSTRQWGLEFACMQGCGTTGL